jgi:hypothetical protein
MPFQASPVESAMLASSGVSSSPVAIEMRLRERSFSSRMARLRRFRELAHPAARGSTSLFGAFRTVSK